MTTLNKKTNKKLDTQVRVQAHYLRIRTLGTIKITVFSKVHLIPLLKNGQ
jgi:hypothetical protein